MAVATYEQRHLIRALMRKLELPLDRVTVMHRDLFKAAGLAWREGADLDAEVSALSITNASFLIRALKERAD